ncbi:MAG TPA: phosphatidylglycerophosphatase A [Casimicrobiaceae bacterium]|nr:phosphatidylglycerophosphatase A [Casimicrobiaceae bacterium]
MRDAIRSDAMNAPSLAFMVRHPAHLIALGFGAGLSPVAPGTIGTLVAFPIAWFLDSHAGTAGWLIAIFAFALVGGWCAQITGRDLRVADHGAIVVDEIAAFLFVLFFAGADAVRQIAAFVLFRIFDVVKPPPIRQIDRATHGALGVMGDDFVAACYTLVVLAIATRLYEAFVP